MGGLASSFGGEEKVDTKDKILWFKPIGVVVDSGVNSSDISLDQIISGGGQVEQHELQDLLDVLNNAANDERHSIDEVTEEFWNERMNINLRHYFFTVQSVKKAMIANKGGSIINIGSVSWMIGQGGMAAYTAAKSGVVGLTRSFARDLGEFDIRVNSVVPGWVMTERQVEKWLTPESEADMLKKQCLKHKLMPSDIAKTVLFFGSDASSGCTNQDYVVDKGWL